MKTSLFGRVFIYYPLSCGVGELSKDMLGLGVVVQDVSFPGPTHSELLKKNIITKLLKFRNITIWL